MVSRNPPRCCFEAATLGEAFPRVGGDPRGHRLKPGWLRLGFGRPREERREAFPARGGRPPPPGDASRAPDARPP